VIRGCIPKKLFVYASQYGEDFEDAAGFGWIVPEVLDDHGLPITDAGLTSVPGLAFLGTPWLVDMGSANLVGVARDAEALVERLD